MRISVVWAIAQKELKGFFGNKKILLSTLYPAILLIPIFLFLLDYLTDSISSEEETYYVGVENFAVESFLAEIPQLDLEIIDFDQAKEMLAQGQLDAFVKLDLSEAVIVVTSLADISGSIYYSGDSSMSTAAAALLDSLLNEAGSVGMEDVSSAGVTGLMSYVYVSMGLLMACAMIAGAYAASCTVREKEVGTLEPLLSTGVGSGEVVLGKFLAIFACSFLISLVSALSTFISLLAGLGGAKDNLSAGVVVTILVVCLSAAVLYSSIFLAVGTMSRNYREVQIYVSILSILSIIPSFMLMFSRVGTANSYWYIPLMNWTTLIRDSFYGYFQVTGLLLSFVPTLVICILALLLGSRFTRIELGLKAAASR